MNMTVARFLLKLKISSASGLLHFAIELSSDRHMVKHYEQNISHSFNNKIAVLSLHGSLALSSIYYGPRNNSNGIKNCLFNR